MFAVVKILISASLIYLVNEVVVRHSKPLLGSLIASLPLVSVLTFIWIWNDLRAKPDVLVEKLSAHSAGVFWFVLPSLPMFLLIPWMLRKGIGFWPAMATGCVITMILYFLMAKLLARFGVMM
ncbi:MAG: DUF3147 family protein [Luteolibacter sp.]|jgi:hypothetical protein